jgi:hypothetical protein
MLCHSHFLIYPSIKIHSCESLEPLMKKLWLRNALLTIPLIAKSMLLPHEINRLVHKLEKISFPRGNVSFIGNMKSALYIVEVGKIQIAVTDGDGVVNTFDQVRANLHLPVFVVLEF